MANVFEAYRAYPEVEWRYLIQPSAWVPNGPRLLIFNNETTWFMQEMGREDGKNALTQPSGAAYIKLAEWFETEEPKTTYQRFTDYMWSFL